jgi:hypothetical protein
MQRLFFPELRLSPNMPRIAIHEKRENVQLISGIALQACVHLMLCCKVQASSFIK